MPVAAGHGVVTPAPLVLHEKGPTPCPELPQGWSRCHLPVPPPSATVPPPAPRLLLCQPKPSPHGRTSEAFTVKPEGSGCLQVPGQVVALAWHVALQLCQGTGLDPSWVSQQHPLEPLLSPVLWEFPPQLCPSGWRELLGPSRWHPSGQVALQWEPGTVWDMVS